MFKTILVPLDQSALAEQAVSTATALARESRGQVGLVLAHKLAPYDGILSSEWSEAMDPAESLYIRAMADEITRGSGVIVNAMVETGSPVEVICRRAHEVNADLIVMTSHGRTGLSRMWLGSVADGVVRTSAVPVLMLRPAPDKPVRSANVHLFQRILVPIDGSTTSAAVLEAAAAMAQYARGTLILARIVIPVALYVFDAGLPAYPTAIVDPEATQQLADRSLEEITALAARMEQEHGIRVETSVTIGEHAAHSILDLATAKDADLIAMTTRGRGSSRLVVGSVTDKVLRGSHLPLLLFHPRVVATAASPVHSEAFPMPSLMPA